MDLDKVQTCRLCFSSGNYQINIFNGLEFNKYVARVINEHIGQVIGFLSTIYKKKFRL